MTESKQHGVTLMQKFGVPSLGQTALGQTPQTPGARSVERQSRHTFMTPTCFETQVALPTEGDIVGDHYELAELLGEGMFGRVHVASRTDVPEHRVALKLITRKVYIGRHVERELAMLAAASHPHIVQLKDHGVSEHYVWLTMPLYAGETLAQRLERGPLSLGEAYDIFVPIARGVQALHDRALRHQDIKPENIFLARFDDHRDKVHPVLLDLGVAVESSSDFVAGTVLFGAPEQVVALGGSKGSDLLSEKMDTYCLATTLLRSLVGVEHYPGELAKTPYELAQSFEERETAPLRPNALPELTGQPRIALSQALGRWMARDPSERPSAGDLASGLDVLLEQAREAAQLIEKGIEGQKTSLRRMRVAAGAMLLVGVGAGMYMYSKRETLQLASELQQARAEGAEHFDKLDTCVASYQLTARQARDCSAGRDDERDEFRRTLDDISSQGDQATASLANRLTSANARMRTCREDAAEAAEAWRNDTEAWADEKQEMSAELERQQSQWRSERQQLTSERDSEKRGRLDCEVEFESSEQFRGECREDLASCIEDRDLCMTPPAIVRSLPAAAPSVAPPTKGNSLPPASSASELPAPPAPKEAANGEPQATPVPDDTI